MIEDGSRTSRISPFGFKGRKHSENILFQPPNETIKRKNPTNLTKRGNPNAQRESQLFQFYGTSVRGTRLFILFI